MPEQQQQRSIYNAAATTTITLGMLNYLFKIISITLF